jgi:hypothetical protein
VLNYIENSLGQLMSETNNESFKAEMIAEIKRIQSELNELKIIKKNIVKKSAKKKVVKRKPARKTTAKKKVVKRKPARKTTAKKKVVKNQLERLQQRKRW